MSLRDEIAKAVQRGIAETPAEYAAPPSVSCLWAADAVLAVLRERADDTTWYCSRFGIAAYEPDICARYGHEGCGKRHVIDFGVEGQ